MRTEKEIRDMLSEFQKEAKDSPERLQDAFDSMVNESKRGEFLSNYEYMMETILAHENTLWHIELLKWVLGDIDDLYE